MSGVNYFFWSRCLSGECYPLSVSLNSTNRLDLSSFVPFETDINKALSEKNRLDSARGVL